MAPNSKGRLKKKSDAMAESESQKTPGLCTAEEMAVKSSNAEEPPSAPEKLELVECPRSKPEGASEGEQKALADEWGEEQLLGDEKEEEQAFLVNLYKFMKERHTPIERVPHLGFKQINLFRIYKVVEKLGAYELVTGRRLWKNVYDILGGSPGSTSAATCTRRHYERLVLPYVRHLKGEDDKPLPPVKPRKQYKVSKEPKGDKASGPTEKKRARKEKMKEQLQVLSEKQAPKGLLPDPKPSPGFEQNQSQEHPGAGLSVPNGQEITEPQAANSCLGNCRAHSCSETYKRLFSSFYVKGAHGIMSPLAKKKLLAQVSKDEALYCHGKHLSHCPAYKKTRKPEISGLDPEAGTWLRGCCQKQAPKKEVGVEGLGSPTGSSQSPKGKEGPLKVSLKDSHLPPQKAEDGNSGGRPSVVPPVFGGSSYTSGSDIPKPGSCHHPRGPAESSPALRDTPGSALSSYQHLGKKRTPGGLLPVREEDPEDQPEDLCQKPLTPSPSSSSSSSSPSSSSWRGESRLPSAFQRRSPSGTRGASPFPHARPSWGPPVANLAKVSPQVAKSSGQTLPPSEVGAMGQKRRATDEDLYMHGKKLKAVSPFVKDLDPRVGVERSPSPDTPRRVAKPKATVASPAFSVAPVSRVQDMYKGMMVRLPLDLSSPEETFKGQPPSLIPSLSISPFLIPAFPTPLLTASMQPSDLCQPLGTNFVHYPASYDGTLRQRLYPLPPWHSPPTYAAPHIPAFHRNTKL